MTKTFGAVVRRDLLLAARQRADVANTLLFFLVVVTMVPLGVGPEINTLRTIAPGVVWVAALLAAILSLNRLFAADFTDGTLEQMVLSGEPLPVVVLAKALGALADHRIADHGHGGAARSDVRPAARRDRRAGGLARPRHAGAVADWRGRCSTDAGPARRAGC